MPNEVSIRDKIKSIMKAELSILLERISEDFRRNFHKKVSNWTLTDFDSAIVAHMVFVSSFESKSGNMFQKIARDIAKIRVGEENIPYVVKGFGVTEEEFEDFKSRYSGTEQIILTRVNQSQCQRFVTHFRETHKARGSRRERINPTLTQEVLKEINDEEFEQTESITSKPVDLIIYSPEEDKYHLMEIKAGGGLDSSNAPANVVKMLTEYAILGKDNVNLYFATLYNFNGEGNTWNGQVKKYLPDELLLIGKDFWNAILPEETSFDELEEIYSEVTRELRMNEKVSAMIREVTQE